MRYVKNLSNSCRNRYDNVNFTNFGNLIFSRFLLFGPTVQQCAAFLKVMNRAMRRAVQGNATVSATTGKWPARRLRRARRAGYAAPILILRKRL